ncbi:MAG TPA: DUF4382 domain-containing protein, partial [Myxococcaceae bacterium]|jgi:hypothetical protein
VHLLLTDAPLDEPGVTRVLVTFTSVEVYSEEDGAWRPVVDYGATGRTFDLLTLTGGKTEEMGAFNLPPGRYDQVRLHLSADNQIEVLQDGTLQLLPLKVPSGEQTGIKLVHPFTVTGKGPTELTVDFDAAKSVKKVGHGWQVKPTIRIAATSTDALATRIVGPEGATVRLLNEGQVEIPPGALSSEVEISIRAPVLIPEYAAERGLYRSGAIQLGPHGLTFAQPVRVTVWYDPHEFPANPASRVSFGAGDNGVWVQSPGEWDTSLGTLSGYTTHFSHFAPINTLDHLQVDQWCGAAAGATAGFPMYPGGHCDISVKAFDTLNNVLKYQEVHFKQPVPGLVTVQPDFGCEDHGADEAACNSDSHCFYNKAEQDSNGNDVGNDLCYNDPDQARIHADQYPGSRVEASATCPGSNGVPTHICKAVQPISVYGFDVWFKQFHVLDDGDNWPCGGGELDLCFGANGFERCDGRQDRDDGYYGTFGNDSNHHFLVTPTSTQSFTVSTHVIEHDDDWPCDSGADRSEFILSYSASSNWGQGGRWNATGGSPNIDFDFQITASPGSP